jgi:hypothetical protein
MASALQKAARLGIDMRVQKRGLKPGVLTLLIALIRSRRMQRALMSDVKIFEYLIEIRQNRRSYC